MASTLIVLLCCFVSMVIGLLIGVIVGMTARKKIDAEERFWLDAHDVHESVNVGQSRPVG